MEWPPVWSLPEKLKTRFATRFRSFILGNETFLAVTNRGCVDIERQEHAQKTMACDATGYIGRTRIWTYNSFEDQFILVPESAQMGTLAAFGIDFQNVPTVEDVDAAVLGYPALPESIIAFQLPSFNLINGFGPLQQYLVIANSRFDVTTVLSTGLVPDNIFQIGASISQVLLVFTEKF